MAPQTMRAVGLRSFGKSDKLEVLEVPVPSIGKPDDILIQVKAVGLNQGDTIRALGYSRYIGEKDKLPIIIGMDYAGVVSAIGEAVTDFAPGDAVYGINLAGGAAAEYMLLTSGYITCIAKLPETMSFDEGASLPAPAFTAITSLFRVDRDIPGGLQGKTVLVSAGLGGIGSILLQLLKPVFGAGKVITTVSTAKVPLISTLLGEGLVDQIVDYTKEDVITEIGHQTVDVLFDTVMTSMSFLPVMKPGIGVEHAFMAKSAEGLKNDWPRTPWIILKLVGAVDAIWRWRARRWGVRFEPAFTQCSKENIDAIDGWAKEGKLKAVIGGAVDMDDLEEVKRMYNIVGSAKGAVGKYVVKIS